MAFHRKLVKILIIPTVISLSGCIYSAMKIKKITDSTDSALNSKHITVDYSNSDPLEIDGYINVQTEDAGFTLPNITHSSLMYVSNDKNKYVNKYTFIEIKNKLYTGGQSLKFPIPHVDGYYFYSFSISNYVKVNSISGYISGKPSEVLNCNKDAPYRINAKYWKSNNEEMEPFEQAIIVTPFLSDKYPLKLIECSPVYSR